MLRKINAGSGRLDDPAAGNRKGVVAVYSDYKPDPYPVDVVNHRHVIVHEELPENLWRGSELQVFVRKVNSPSEFWINLCGLDYSRKLVTLRANMRKFYEQAGDKYLLPDYAVRIGQFCVCIYRNEWHRARIVKTSVKDQDIVDVFLIDCGSTVTVAAENLRFLHKTFSCLPIQGFLADLPDVKPIGGAAWPTGACDFFREETSGRKLRAKLVNVFRERHAVSLTLFDVSGNSISGKLLANGMAVATAEDAAARSKELASSVRVENVVRISEDTSPKFKDDCQPEDEKAASRSEGAPASWRNVDHKYVTIAGKTLLLVTIKKKNYFVLSDFLQAFAALHEHVVLKLLEAFPTLVVVERMDFQQLRQLLGSLEGRRVRGLSHLLENGVTPSVHLLPVHVACHLLTFLGEDTSQAICVHDFVSSLY